MKRNGMNVYTINDILGLTYRPVVAIALAQREQGGNLEILDAIPSSFKWSFEHTGSNYEHLMGERFMLVGVPMTVVENFILSKRLSDVLSDNLLPDDLLSPVYELHDSAQSRLGKLETDYSTGFLQPKKSICFLWLFLDGEFSGIYVESPERLLRGGLDPKQTYTCSVCGVQQVVENDIPDMYYDPFKSNQPSFCSRCAHALDDTAFQHLKHMGE